MDREGKAVQEEVSSGFSELHNRVERLERGLAENTAATKRIESDTSEMVEIFRGTKSGLKVLGYFGGVLKWAAAIGVAILTAWAAFRGAK